MKASTKCSHAIPQRGNAEYFTPHSRFSIFHGQGLCMYILPVATERSNLFRFIRFSYNHSVSIIDKICHNLAQGPVYQILWLLLIQPIFSYLICIRLKLNKQTNICMYVYIIYVHIYKFIIYTIYYCIYTHVYLSTKDWLACVSVSGSLKSCCFNHCHNQPFTAVRHHFVILKWN